MNILKYEKISICGCDMCINTNSKTNSETNILERILSCNCKSCKKSFEIPGLYLSCIQLHFLYLLSHDINTVNNTILSLKNDYIRKKNLFILYSRFVGKILKIYKEVKYRPGNSGYLEAFIRFTRMCK